MNNASIGPLLLQLTGNPLFFYAGEPLRELRTQKAQALLIYLVVQDLLHPGKGFAKEKLTDLLWPRMPLDSALQNLRQTLYQIRKAVSGVSSSTKEKVPLIETNRKTIRLHPQAGIKTDLDGLLLSQEAAKDDLLPDDGLFLENFYVPGCEEYEAWVEQLRNLVRERHLQVLKRQAQCRLSAGDALGAVKLARRLVSLEPLDETGQLLFMQALYSGGQQTEAMRVYQQYRNRLEEELAVQPGVALEKWHNQIKANPEFPLVNVPSPFPKRQARKYNRFANGLGLASLLLIILLLGWAGLRNHPPSAIAATSPSIAVLPFENYTNQKYLADGLADDIITQLSYVPQLRVMSGLSSLQYRNSEKTARQIGQALNVEFLLKGSVQQVAGQIKVNVQMVHVASDTQRWATSVMRPSSELFAIQSDLAREIAGALRIALNPTEERRLDKFPTRDAQAYEEFLQGRFQLYQDPPQNLYSALEHFEKAVALDSGFVGAYEYMAHTLADLASGWGDQSIIDVYPRIKSILQRTEDHPFYPDLRFETQAWVQLWFYQLDSAERYFRKAIEANPSSEWGLPSLSQCLSIQGNKEEALEIGQRATANNPASLYSRQVLATAHMLAGNHDQAREHGLKALALNPRHVHSIKILAQNYTLQGKYQNAIQLLTQSIRDAQIDDYDPYLLGRLGVAYARRGNQKDAEAILKTMLKEYQKKRRHFDYFIAMTYESLGKTEKAMDWLERAKENREGELLWMYQDPEFAGLRNYPRYQVLARKMKASNQVLF